LKDTFIYCYSIVYSFPDNKCERLVIHSAQLKTVVHVFRMSPEH